MPYGYLCDPLFLVCLALYFANRWILKVFVPLAFFRNHLNDLICIPFWIPIILFAMRKLGFREDDSPPKAHELLVPLLIWSCAFEIVLPRTESFKKLAFADPFDILFYALGALAAAVFWRWWYRTVEQ